MAKTKAPKTTVKAEKKPATKANTLDFAGTASNTSKALAKTKSAGKPTTDKKAVAPAKPVSDSPYQLDTEQVNFPAPIARICKI